jgi:hypothetical protein
MDEYKVKPIRFKRCIICFEKVTEDDELVGGKMKRGGTRCAHRSCWEREQAENARRVKP